MSGAYSETAAGAPSGASFVSTAPDATLGALDDAPDSPWHIPAFCLIPAEQRRAAWEANPPKPLAPMVAREVELAREIERKRQAYERIERMKAKKAVKPAAEAVAKPPEGARWDARRARWVVDGLTPAVERVSLRQKPTRRKRKPRRPF